MKTKKYNLFHSISMFEKHIRQLCVQKRNLIIQVIHKRASKIKKRQARI